MINNPVLPRIQDEGVAQGIAHTLNFAGAGVTATVSGGVATVTIPGGGGGGGSLTVTAFNVAVPYETYDLVVNVVDGSVSGTSKVLLLAGQYNDTDENDPSDIYFGVKTIAAGSFDFRIQSKESESIGGLYKFQYFLG